jgi:hypothetical protein
MRKENQLDSWIGNKETEFMEVLNYPLAMCVLLLAYGLI